MAIIIEVGPNFEVVSVSNLVLLIQNEREGGWGTGKGMRVVTGGLGVIGRG